LPPNADGTLNGTPAKTDYLYWNLYDEQGNNSGPIRVNAEDVFDEAGPGGTGENLWSFTVDIDDVMIAGEFIDAMQFTMGFGDIKITKIEVSARGNTPPNDIFLDFSATRTDADGDSASTNFEVDLYGNDILSEEQPFDYTLLDAGTGPDAFNAEEGSSYLVQGFDTDIDTLVLLNLADGYTLETGVDGDGDGSLDDSRVTSNLGDLEVVVQDQTIQATDIAEADTLI
jgi:hypothetical protein